jgi:hypothetical protein
LTDDDNIVASESVRLRELWDQQKIDADERKEERRSKMENILPSNLFDHDNTNSGTLSRWGRVPGNILLGDRTPSSGYHAMVLLGTLKEGENISFLFLNSWPSMPLVLVSLGYLRTCKAKVYFLKRALSESTSFKRREGFVAECLFGDGGENEHAPDFCLRARRNKLACLYLIGFKNVFGN